MGSTGHKQWANFHKRLNGLGLFSWLLMANHDYTMQCKVLVKELVPIMELPDAIHERVNERISCQLGTAKGFIDRAPAQQ